MNRHLTLTAPLSMWHTVREALEAQQARYMPGSTVHQEAEAALTVLALRFVPREDTL